MKNTHGFTVAQTLPHNTGGSRRVGPASARRQGCRHKTFWCLETKDPAPAGLTAAFPPPSPVGSCSSEAFQQNTGSAGWKPTLEAPDWSRDKPDFLLFTRPFVRCFCSARLLNPNSQHLDNKRGQTNGIRTRSHIYLPSLQRDKGLRV